VSIELRDRVTIVSRVHAQWAARRWLEILPKYARKNPERLVFPGSRGARRPPGKHLHKSIKVEVNGKTKVRKKNMFRE